MQLRRHEVVGHHPVSNLNKVKGSLLLTQSCKERQAAVYGTPTECVTGAGTGSVLTTDNERFLQRTGGVHRANEFVARRQSRLGPGIRRIPKGQKANDVRESSRAYAEV
jgi:hypothetical protein